jgi:hypothetical protein
VLVQANKRDLPDALPVDAIRHVLGLGVAETIIETVAATGEGVREASCSPYAMRCTTSVRADAVVTTSPEPVPTRC